MELPTTFDEFCDFYDLKSIKEVLVENEFSSIQALLVVGEDDLKEMGINALGKRKHFIGSIENYKMREKLILGEYYSLSTFLVVSF